jgi:predicted DNA-binding transcriptional regulator YafY
VLFNPEVAKWVSERKWSNDQVIKWNDDGKMFLTMTCSSYTEITSWVLSFGSKAEVLSPDWLRKDLAQESKQLALLYTAI